MKVLDLRAGRTGGGSGQKIFVLIIHWFLGPRGAKKPENFDRN